MNSRWSRRDGTALLAILIAACGGKKKPATPAANLPPVDPVQAEAQHLGLEVRDIVDRVMAFRSSHGNRLPTSLRQAGIDSLTSDFIRRLGRQGTDPLITVVYRRTQDRHLLQCAGTNMVLEDAMLHEGAFEVNCETSGGGSRTFTVAPPPPPPPATKD